MKKNKSSLCISFFLPKALLDRVDEVAQDRYMSRSAVLTQIILQWLDSPEVFPAQKRRVRKKRPTTPNGAASDDNDHA
jgi:metal-responsive CopG/Arc/MetJ family transcriptional regulator